MIEVAFYHLTARTVESALQTLLERTRARGWRAGRVQLGIDLSVLAVAATVLPADRAAYSVLGALVMGLFLAINHKPGRYAGA